MYIKFTDVILLLFHLKYFSTKKYLVQMNVPDPSDEGSHDGSSRGYSDEDYINEETEILFDTNAVVTTQAPVAKPARLNKNFDGDRVPCEALEKAINEEREKNGLNQLYCSRGMRYVAMKHAQNLDRANTAGLDWHGKLACSGTCSQRMPKVMIFQLYNFNII